MNGLHGSLPGQPKQEEVPPLPLSALPDVVQDGVEVHPSHLEAASPLSLDVNPA